MEQKKSILTGSGNMDLNVQYGISNVLASGTVSHHEYTVVLVKVKAPICICLKVSGCL